MWMSQSLAADVIAFRIPEKDQPADLSGRLIAENPIPGSHDARQQGRVTASAVKVRRHGSRHLTSIKVHPAEFVDRSTLHHRKTHAVPLRAESLRPLGACASFRNRP